MSPLPTRFITYTLRKNTFVQGGIKNLQTYTIRLVLQFKSMRKVIPTLALRDIAKHWLLWGYFIGTLEHNYYLIAIIINWFFSVQVAELRKFYYCTVIVIVNNYSLIIILHSIFEYMVVLYSGVLVCRHFNVLQNKLLWIDILSAV